MARNQQQSFNLMDEVRKISICQAVLIHDTTCGRRAISGVEFTKEDKIQIAKA